MAFGPIMRFTVGGLRIELAPMTREAMGEFVNYEHGGGLQTVSTTEWLGMNAAPVTEDEYDWYDKTRSAKNTLIWGIWLLSGEGENSTRTLIGNSALTGIDTDGHSKLIRQATSASVIFRKEYRGIGIGSAAHKARTWYTFEYMGLHRIKSAVLQANVGSRTALERSGYVFVYTERNEQYSSGKLHHLDCLECLNPLPLFWNTWWHGEAPPKVAVDARRKTRAAMAWAAKNVELA